jgi:hypothetical protein
MHIRLGANERDFLDLTDLIESNDSIPADVSKFTNMFNKGSAHFVEATCGARKGLSPIEVEAGGDLGFISADLDWVAKDFL